MVHEKPYEKDTKEDMQRVFNDIDQDLKGFIDEDDLRNMAS
jgi:Ca2+-binding EF-hand superfamily protein